MGDPIVFRDSPLGQYLQENAAGDSDWGIDSPIQGGRRIQNHGLSQTYDLSTNRNMHREAKRHTSQPNFGPPLSLGYNSRLLTPRPVCAGNVHETKRAKFKLLFSSAFSTRLTPVEDQHFIERFRYLICSSHLLGDNITVSLYKSDKKEVSEAVKKSLRSLGYDATKSSKRQWVGGSGCVMIIVILINWALKSKNKNEQDTDENSRWFIAFSISVTTAFYLYAYTV